MGELRANGHDHEKSTNRSSIIWLKAGGVDITGVKLLKQPVLFYVEIVGLGIFEKDLDQKIRYISRGQTSEGG